MTKDMLLWIGDHRGLYIPRDFANSFVNRERDVSGVDAEDWEILEAGPDHEYYWDTWADVCDHARVTDGETVYSVYQDGDCWLVPVGMEWNEETDCFEWPGRKPLSGGE